MAPLAQNADGPMRLVELDALDASTPLAEVDAPLAARRTMTLLVPLGNGSQHGGSGRATKAFNAYGEALCLKSLVASDGPSYRARAAAFRAEYLAQRLVSGLEGWPATYGYGTYGGGPVILMEWVQGSTLHVVAPHLPRVSGRDAGPAPEWIASVGVRVLQLLEAAATREPGFAHRDLSPRNVMVRLDRVSLRDQISRGLLDLVLVDLGSATNDGEAVGDFTQRTRVWRNGTTEYAPPEMLTHDAPGIELLRHSPKIDVYALCSVLFELYSGHTPYRLEGRADVSPYRTKMDLSPIAVAPRSTADAGLLACIRAGLARQQRARPDVAGLMRMLLGWLAGYAPGMARVLVDRPPEERFVPPARDVRIEMLPVGQGGQRGSDASLPAALLQRMR